MAITATKVPDEFGMTKNPIVFGFQSDDPTAEKVLLQVWVETSHDSGNYELAFRGSIQLDANQYGAWRIDDALRAYLSFSLPDPNDHTLQTKSDMLRRYNIKYAEKTASHLMYIQSLFHEDLTGNGPEYLSEVLLDQPLEIGSSYVVELEHDDPTQLANVSFKSSTSSNSNGIGAVTQQGKYCYKETSQGVTYAFDILQIPANTPTIIYKGPITYEETDVFIAWLAGSGKKSI